MNGGRQSPLAQLTSLRFFAALLVLFSHLIFFERSGNQALSGLYDYVFRQGACGVTFFFILSGFILTHAYERALNDGGIPVLTYLYRRVVRIFPLHLMVGVAFLAYLALRGDLPPSRAVFFNFTLLHSWIADPLVHYSLNGPSWSLSDELFFYALFPLLVKLDQRILQWLFGVGLTVIVAGACFAALHVNGYSPFIDWLFYVFPVTRLFEFIAGILLYRAWQAGIGRSWATSASELLLVALVLTIMFSVEWFAVPVVFRYQLAFLPPMAALVLIFAYGGGALSHLLRNSTLQLLGEASFALYLIHRPMITFVERWAGRGTASDVALALAILVLANLAAVFTFVLLDQPVQRWLRRRKSPREATGLALRKG